MLITLGARPDHKFLNIGVSLGEVRGQTRPGASIVPMFCGHFRNCIVGGLWLNPLIWLRDQFPIHNSYNHISAHCPDSDCRPNRDLQCYGFGDCASLLSMAEECSKYQWGERPQLCN